MLRWLLWLGEVHWQITQQSLILYLNTSSAWNVSLLCCGRWASPKKIKKYQYCISRWLCYSWSSSTIKTTNGECIQQKALVSMSRVMNSFSTVFHRVELVNQRGFFGFIIQSIEVFFPRAPYSLIN